MRRHVYEFDTPNEFSNLLTKGDYTLYEKIEGENYIEKGWSYLVSIQDSTALSILVQKDSLSNSYNSEIRELYINTDKYREIGSFKLDKDKLVTIISEIDEPGISRLAYYNPQFVMGTTYLIYIGLTMILLVLLLVNVILLIVLKSKRKVDLDVVLD